MALPLHSVALYVMLTHFKIQKSRAAIGQPNQRRVLGEPVPGVQDLERQSDRPRQGRDAGGQRMCGMPILDLREVLAFFSCKQLVLYPQSS